MTSTIWATVYREWPDNPNKTHGWVRRSNDLPGVPAFAVWPRHRTSGFGGGVIDRTPIMAEEHIVSEVATEAPRQVRHEAQRIEILKAAAEAIAEHGFYGMTMRGLARATGRGLASFYDYFSSKEDLLFSLQTGAFESMAESVTAALEDVDEPIDRLYVFVLNHLRYAAEHKSVMRVLVHEASALPAARRKTVRLLKERYFNICRDIVATILAAGCKTPGAGGVDHADAVEVERITYSVFGMLNWSYGWYDPRQHGTPQDVAKTIHALAVCGLVARCPNRVAHVDLDRHVGEIVPTPLAGRSAHHMAALGNRRALTEKNVARGSSRKTP